MKKLILLFLISCSSLTEPVYTHEAKAEYRMPDGSVIKGFMQTQGKSAMFVRYFNSKGNKIRVIPEGTMIIKTSDWIEL